MPSIQARTSRGRKYWSIVESRRINGQPRTVILEYLGTADTLLQRLTGQARPVLTSYSHGDTAALLATAQELNVVDIINKHVPVGADGRRPMRDNLSVGASLLFAALGRACSLTSKRGWYEWCKETSLEYQVRMPLKDLDSQHFWDQMHALPAEQIEHIEQEIVQRLAALYKPDFRTLLFDTTNFFTFIDSTNTRCTIARRGKNKQKRGDLRQIGLALAVSRHEQFPLFHKTYEGNKNDVTVFKETLGDIIARLKSLSLELSDITLIFDKGNNSKANFTLLDAESSPHYVASLIPSHFKTLMSAANLGLMPISVDGQELLVYKTTTEIWGRKRTCVVFVSELLRDGQTRGVLQHLEKKYKELDKFQRILNGKKKFSIAEIEERLATIIEGQFVPEILKFEVLSPKQFVYYCDFQAFANLKKSVFGRQLLVTDQDAWSEQEIILAYKGKTKVEYSFRNLKNPFHLALRPQFHWTDQKIKVHAFICLLAYLLAFAVFKKAKDQAHYSRDIDALLEDLRSIRLASILRSKGRKVAYQLERMPAHLATLAAVLGVSNGTLRQNCNFSDYTPH